MHRRALLTIRMDPGNRHRVCHDLENQGGHGTDPSSSHRHLVWPNAKHNDVSRPSTPSVPQTPSRTAVGHWPARQVGSPRGGIALRPPIPPGLRNGPHDPRATRPTPRNTSNGPSCLCPCRCAITAPAVASRPSGQRSSSTVSSPSPHDALCSVLYAALTRRCKNAEHAPQVFSSLYGPTFS